MKVLLALLVLIAVHYASAGFSQCYVNLAYSGTDSDCTDDKPFPSIESALTYFYNTTNVGDAFEGLDLVLFPGNYYINGTITFQSPVNITYNDSDDAPEDSSVSFLPGAANVVAFSFPYDFTVSGPINFSGFDTAIVAQNTKGVYGGLNDVTFSSLELSVLIATNLTTLDVNNVKANVITDDADDGNTFTVNNVDTFTIKNSVFTGIGGVAFVNVVSGGEIEDSTFDNTALTIAAATIDTAVTITNSNFTNFVDATATAAVSISGSQQVYVEEITFQNNKNHFTLTNSFATIKDSLFSGNTEAAIGGALLITANSIVTAEGTTWTLNSASANGGGVFVKNSTFSAETSTFSNNTADNGAAIACDGASSFVNVTAGDGNVFTFNVNTVAGGVDVDCSNINQTESQSAIVSTPSSGGSLWWVWVIVAIVVVIVIIIVAGAIAFFIYQRKRLSYDRME